MSQRLVVRSIHIAHYTAGANPMIPGAPHIDTFVDIHTVFGRGRLQIQGTIRGDNFPNAEVFIVDKFGGTSLLFDFKTTGDKTLALLPALFR